MALAMVLTFAGAASAQEDEEPVILYTGRQMGPDDIPTLDPSQARDVPSVQVIAEIFPELGRYQEEDVYIQPGMATWEVSEDGTTYTFHITPEVPWVFYNQDTGEVEMAVDEEGNVRYVTANDYITGITRTMDPQVASDYAGVLAPWIVGGVEWMNSDPEAGEEERAELLANVGVRAIDDYTLEWQAPFASPVVDAVASIWISTAEPTWLIEEVGDFWIEPEYIHAYGPYAVKEWYHDESLTMIKNPYWPGTESIPQAQIDEVVLEFLDDSPQLAAFEAGELDVSEVPEAAIDRIVADPELSQMRHIGNGTCTYYYGFNQTRAPFDDPRAVRAFSMAIDREAIAENITGAGEAPANFFTLPNMVAAATVETHPDLGVYTDPEAAAALWQEYLDDTGQSIDDFSLTLLHNNSELHAAIAQAVQQMWVETLGIEVQIASQDFGTYLDLRRDADIYRAAWCYDFPDTHNWLYDVFHTSNDPDNHFSNEEYDSLVDQARRIFDTDERRELYAQAEHILVWEAASIAPIYHYITHDLTQPNINRTYSQITREYYEKWSIEGE
jgi:oligopeptide transport system substrate-binding protein